MPLSTYFNDNTTQPEYSRPFAPHLIAIKDSFVSSFGHIFDFKRWYVHGGCSDKSYYSPNFEYDTTVQPIAEFTEPVLSLVHPYPGLFFHEFIEIHASLLMSLPLLKLMPNITIIVNRYFQQTQLFPLLQILGIDYENFNFLSLKSDNRQTKRNAKLIKSTAAIVYAPYIITPLSLWCQYISRTTTNKMRQGYSKLPYWGMPGNGILISDRYNMRPKRSLNQGRELFQILNSTYGHQHSVRMFHGNESLEQTIRLFRDSRVFVAAHGGGESNLIFMEKGSSVVEIRPMSWPITCFIDLSNNIGINHFMYIDESKIRNQNRKRFPELSIQMNDFIPWVNKIINKALNTNLIINTTTLTNNENSEKYSVEQFS